MKLNTDKAPGADLIRSRDVKLIATEIVPAIKTLINVSVSSGIYPDKLKVGMIRPIYKKGQHALFSNYRPITILSCINKLLEKFIGDQIQKYLCKNNIITPHQFGFQPNKSTSQMLDIFSDEINEHLNNRKHVLVGFIDYSKAFDTLLHKTLHDKLQQCGIRGPLLNLLQDYHRNRQTFVKIGDTESDKTDVKYGTAQGSILGPIEYIIYVNDMATAVKTCTMYQFADDTAIVSAHAYLREAQLNLQTDFNNVSKWSHDMGLIINADKTNLLHIHSAHNKTQEVPNIVAHLHSCIHSPVINCSCPSIPVVSECKYVGLIVDKYFNWRSHVDLVCNKLRSLYAKFKILKYRLPTSTLILLYKTMVDSVVSYGLSIYGRTFQSYLNEIYKLQLRILKIISPTFILNKYKNSPIELFYHYNTLPIFEQFELIILKQYNNNASSNISLNKISHKLITRAMTSEKYILPRYTNFYGARLANLLIPKLLNELPTDLRLQFQTTKFNNRIKIFYRKKKKSTCIRSNVL